MTSEPHRNYSKAAFALGALLGAVPGCLIAVVLGTIGKEDWSLPGIVVGVPLGYGQRPRLITDIDGEASWLSCCGWPSLTLSFTDGSCGISARRTGSFLPRGENADSEGSWAQHHQVGNNTSHRPRVDVMRKQQQGDQPQ
jgi:hypothetical protein